MCIYVWGYPFITAETSLGGCAANLSSDRLHVDANPKGLKYVIVLDPPMYLYLWSLLDGIWGVSKGSWGVLGYRVFQASKVGILSMVLGRYIVFWHLEP